MQRVALAWSSGKDSAWLLCELLQRDDIEVAALLTTVRESDGAVGIHETHREILRAQAGACNLPLYEVELPWPCPNAEYEWRLRDTSYILMTHGITALAFGDLFLADIRAYREQLFGETGMELLFPLWQRDTALLASEMLAGGLRARICCISRGRLDPQLLGAEYDDAFLAALPPGVDPCGENGEFHSIVTDCPAFAAALRIATCGSGEDEFHHWLQYRLAD